MLDYQIKPIELDDVLTLQALAKETFKATFDPFTKPEDMEQFLETDYRESLLREELQNPASYWYFLLTEGQVAGYLKLNEGSAQTEQVKDNAMEVQRIYLRKQFQHHGLGSVLMEFAEQQARLLHKAYMWLGVYEKNVPARKLYAKYGFERVGEHVFQVGEDKQIDYLLAKKLDY